MLGILSSLMRTATRQDPWGPDADAPTHYDHLLAHERRKAEELRKQRQHRDRYFR